MKKPASDLLVELCIGHQADPTSFQSQKDRNDLGLLQVVGRAASITAHLLDGDATCKQSMLDLTLQGQPMQTSHGNVQTPSVSMLQLSLGWLARCVNAQQPGEFKLAQDACQKLLHAHVELLHIQRPDLILT